MKVKTELLKQMLSHTSKVKANSYLEISNYFELFFSKNGLILTATDGNNYLVASTEEGKQENEQRIIVKGEQITKLVNKTTKEEIELIVHKDYLEIRGNGVYKVELFTEEDYPALNMDIDTTITVATADLIHAINCSTNCKSDTTSDGVLYSYLVRDEKLVAADSIKVACINIPNFTEEVLISPAMAKMLTAMDAKECKVEIDTEGQKIRFTGDNIIVSGALMEGASEYPDVFPIVEQACVDSCRIDSLSLLGAIDRLRIFLGLYDDNELDLVFTKSALVISTKSGSTETLGYKEGEQNSINEELVCTIKSTLLADIVSSITEPIFTIYIGDGLLKFESGEDIYLLATVEEE